MAKRPREETEAPEEETKVEVVKVRKVEAFVPNRMTFEPKLDPELVKKFKQPMSKADMNACTVRRTYVLTLTGEGTSVEVELNETNLKEFRGVMNKLHELFPSLMSF